MRHPARQRRLLASLAESGQQTPIVVAWRIASGWRRSSPSITAIRVKPARCKPGGAKAHRRSANAFWTIPRCFFKVLSPARSQPELVRRLNCHLPQVDRLLDPLRASRLDQLEAASVCSANAWPSKSGNGFVGGPQLPTCTACDNGKLLDEPPAQIL